MLERMPIAGAAAMRIIQSQDMRLIRLVTLMLKFFLDMEKEPILTFSIERVLQPEHRVKGAHEVNAAAGPDEQLVRHTTTYFVVGIVLYVAEVTICFDVNRKRKVPKLAYGHRVDVVYA